MFNVSVCFASLCVVAAGNISAIAANDQVQKLIRKVMDAGSNPALFVQGEQALKLLYDPHGGL